MSGDSISSWKKKKIELLLLIPCPWFVTLTVMNSEVSAPKAWLLLSINTDYTGNESKEWLGWMNSMINTLIFLPFLVKKKKKLKAVHIDHLLTLPNMP